MRTFLRPLVAVGLVALLVIGCGPTVSGGAAATVNGTVISRTQLEDAVRELVGDVESMSAEERELEVGTQQRQLLTLMITAQILEDAVQAQGIEITQEDRDTVRQEVIDAVGGEDELEPALEGAGLTMDLFENVYLTQQAHIVALRDHLLGDQSMETRTVRHILVETQEEADDIVAQLADEGDFAELALEHSMDPGSGQAGGDLGPAPRGQYVPAFDEAAWNAQIGEIVGPIETDFGFHIIEVTDEGETSASDMPPEQVDALIGEDLNDIFEAAFDEAEITIGSGLGVWDEATRQVVSEDEVGDPPVDGEPPVDGDPPADGDVPEDAPEDAPEEQ